MRASIAASRQSQLPSSVANAAATAKLLEKKKEFEAVAALERASAQFLKRIEELGDDFEVMAEAGIGASASVPSRLCVSPHPQFTGRSWSSGRICSVFSVFSVRVSARLVPQSLIVILVSQREQQAEADDASGTAAGERLVRIPVEELKPADPNAS